MGFPTTLSMSLVSSISFEGLDSNLSDFIIREWWLDGQSYPLYLNC